MDGILFRLSEECFWFVQPDGNMWTWFLAHKNNYQIKINDPISRVLQIQGPNSFKILNDLTDGKIMYTKNNVKAPLSKKHLLTCLSQYFSDIPNIQPDEVANYILENREIKTKEGIRHKS